MDLRAAASGLFRESVLDSCLHRSVLLPRRVQRFFNHLPAFSRDFPAQSMFFIQSAQRVEIKKGGAGFDAWTGEHGDSSLPIVMLIGMSVTLAAASHCVHDKRRGVESGRVAADMLLNFQTRLQ